MSRHPSPEQLQRHVERSLPSGLFLIVDRHVASCSACREYCQARSGAGADYTALLSALLPDPADDPAHLSAAEAAAYAVNKLGEIELEIAEGHLENCAACRERLRELGKDRNASSKILTSPRPAPRTTTARRPASRSLNLLASGSLNKAAAVAALSVCLLLVATLILNQSASFRQTDPSPAPGRNNNDASGVVTEADRPGVLEDARPEAARTELGNTSPPADGGRVAQPPPQNILTLSDAGRQVGLDERGALLGLEDLRAPLRQAVRAALVAQKVEVPDDLKELAGESSTLLSATKDVEAFRLISPVGRIVRGARPTFRWHPLAGGGASYRINVTDEDLNEVAVSEALTATEWRIPRELRRGTTYLWQVTAIKEGKEIVAPVLPAPPAKFKVLGRAEDEELKRLEKSHPKSHLALGVLYARAGLLEEARREFQSLVKANPKSGVTRRLLESAVAPVK